MLKNIIYDFGGVLLNLDFSRSFKAFGDLGFTDFEDMYAQNRADALFKDLETGAVSRETFYDSLASMGTIPVTHQQLENAWNAMLLNLRKNSFAFLKTLQNRFNVYLLSNTNEIHYEAFHKKLFDELGEQSFDPFFKKTYFSHLLHLRKPGVEIYGYVLNDAGLNAAETLFIDDTLINLPNAGRTGMKTHLLQRGQLIEELDYSLF